MDLLKRVDSHLRDLLVAIQTGTGLFSCLSAIVQQYVCDPVLYLERLLLELNAIEFNKTFLPKREAPWPLSLQWMGDRLSTNKHPVAVLFFARITHTQYNAMIEAVMYKDLQCYRHTCYKVCCCSDPVPLLLRRDFENCIYYYGRPSSSR